MARLNTPPPPHTAPVTFEGTPAKALTPSQALRRAVVSTMLFEDTFYEKGSTVADRLVELVPQVPAEEVAALAVEAREKFYLRHVPLFLVRELARGAKTTPGVGALVADTLDRVIQRPDELGEYIAMYYRDGEADKRKSKEKISAASKRGLAKAFGKFSVYQLAKYNRDSRVKLKDVIRIAHPKPAGPAQAALYKQVLTDTLPTPDTWEVALSGGADKKEAFERLLREGKLGGLAFLRNLRNMIEAKVDPDAIRARFDGNFDKVLPFRFITAARYAPSLEPLIERAMLRACDSLPKLAGTTALVVDTSPSMWDSKVSSKSELTRFDAAAALAILARELCETVHVWTFNHDVYEVPSRRGFALRDALAQTKGSASCGGLGVQAANARGYDRILVLTDGEWHAMPSSTGRRIDPWSIMSSGKAEDMSPPPLTASAYMINVAPYRNAYSTSKWHNVDGWSERILDFVVAMEAEELR